MSDLNAGGETATTVLRVVARKSDTALYDGIRGLYRHTRVAAHYSVMEVTPNQTILGVLARSPLWKSVMGVLARSQRINFHNNHKNVNSTLPMHRAYMLASCDTADSDWGTLLVCVGVIFLILRHLRNDESDDDTDESPPTMFS